MEGRAFVRTGRVVDFSAAKWTLTCPEGWLEVTDAIGGAGIPPSCAPGATEDGEVGVCWGPKREMVEGERECLPGEEG